MNFLLHFSNFQNIIIFLCFYKSILATSFIYYNQKNLIKYEGFWGFGVLGFWGFSRCPKALLNELQHKIASSQRPVDR